MMTENFEYSVNSYVSGIKTILLKVKDEKWKDFPHLVMSDEYLNDAENVKRFEVRSNDIFLCGYPRSGTTMMQEMIWLIANDFNFEMAKSLQKSTRFPLLEGYGKAKRNDMLEDKKIIKNFSNSSTAPRTIKTHLSVQFLPDQVWQKKPKIIHISRDVKDVVVSNFYYHKDFYNDERSFDEFVRDFISGNKVTWCPYREHCVNFWKLQDYDNILYLNYECVVENVKEAIEKVGNFLGKPGIKKEDMEALKQHLSFNSMKTNDACNNSKWIKQSNLERGGTKDQKIEGFIRKGIAGGFKDEMSQEMIKEFDEWMSESLKFKRN